MAMGWMSYTFMVVLSPGMTISVPRPRRLSAPTRSGHHPWF